MATKFVLGGGYLDKATDGGKAFYEELIKDYAEPVKVLVCLFARQEETWNQVFEETKEVFKNCTTKSIEFKMATQQEFAEQVKWANTIFLKGGFTEQLLSVLRTCGGWKNDLAGKTIAGSSAGADVLVKYFYNLDTLQLGAGLGLIPAKVLVHYQSDYNTLNINWEKIYSELQEYKEELPVLALKEGEFTVINN